MVVGQDRYLIEIHSPNKSPQFPIIKGCVEIKWDRNYSSGSMKFSVVKDDNISYNEGDTVVFSVNGEVFFKGYVFNKKRDKNQVIETLCYDSLRYLVQNKDTYQYSSMSMSDLIRKICSDRLLEVGEIEDTGYKIPKRIEKDKSYMSMIKYADEVTLSQTGKILTLFDDRGKISLKSANSMYVDYPITYDNSVDFDYETSIDKGTYNRVVVYIVDDNNRVLRKVVKQDEYSISKWGVLEYTVTTNNDEDIDSKASQLLEIFNRVFRSLKIKNAIGDRRVRAGSLIPVRFMAIGDINISSLMIVDSVTHKFEDGNHFMDLEVFNKDVMPIGKGDGIISDKKKEKSGNGTSFSADNLSEKKEKMLDSAFSMLGHTYSQSNRNGSSSSDCSSFVWKAMKDAGYDVSSYPFTTYTMRDTGLFSPISFGEVRAGDIGIHHDSTGGHTVIALSKSEIIHQTPPKARRQSMGKYENYKWYRINE